MNVGIKRSVSLLMALVMCLVLSGVALAAEDLVNDMQPDGTVTIQWVNTTSIVTTLSFDGSRGTCGARVLGKPGTDYITATVGVYSFVHISLNNRGQAGDDLTFWQAVACHEFGHGLGLMHNDWTTVPSVMRDGTPAYYPNPGYYTPQQADRNAISGRYWQ